MTWEYFYKQSDAALFLYIASLEARIAELEAPKNCNGCKYEANCFILNSLNARMVTSDFCCNRYEPKGVK
jgi:hypothetical protein